MRIPFEDINNTEFGPLYVGERARLASCSGVRFLEGGRLLATSLVGQRMYVLRYDYDAGTHEVLSEVTTRFRGEDVSTDLVDWDGDGRVAVSNCDRDSVSFYRLDGDALFHERDLVVDDPEAVFCHGIQFGPRGSGLLCATFIHGDHGVYLLSETGAVIYKFTHGDWIARDACFVAENRIVVGYSKSHPGAVAVSEPLGDGVAALVELDLERGSHTILHELAFDACRIEACVYRNGTLFLADQVSDRVIECELAGDAITPAYELVGYDFPHGVDFLPERRLLAVTNYGNNSVILTQL